jgi:MFS family permease
VTPARGLWSLAPSVFLPALVYEIGNGAMAPVIALTALAEGASVRTAGFTLAVMGVGQILGDVPAGILADRLGDRRAMAVASGLALVGQLTILVSHSLWLLGAGLLVIGSANGTYYLGRMSYLSEVIPPGLRARAMSTMGGSHRIGLLIGPFVGAAAISLTGLRAAYVVAMVATVSAAALLLLVPDPERQQVRRRAGGTGGATSWRMLVDHRRLFATLGAAVFLVGAVRAARQTVVPLWADHIGLSPEHTSLVFGIASIVDVAMFYPSGLVMDRFGRLSVAIPAMVVLGTTMVLLPLTGSALGLTVVAMVMSLGNGIGSGIMQTLGADTSPAEGRARFLAVWRLLSDSGNATGPLVVSVVAVVAGLAGGIVAVGCTGLLAAVALGRWVPRYSAYATPASVRRQRAEALHTSE